MENDAPDHKPNLIAFLFCKDVIVEQSGVSPFRLIDGVDVHIPHHSPGSLFAWDNPRLNVFIGVACYTPDEHEHRLKLLVFAPDGTAMGVGNAIATPGGDTPGSYRNIDVALPAQMHGRFEFRLEIDGECRATSYFFLKHVTEQHRPGESTVHSSKLTPSDA